MKRLKILVACEESDQVRGQFEKMGFDAWSCDLQPNRNSKAKHYQGNVFDILSEDWSALIAFPPCTHLAVSGAAWFEEKRQDGRQKEAVEFFMALTNAKIEHIAIENPIGIMSTYFRKPDQIIHPFYFGDEVKKATCLWLKNLPLLQHSKEITLFDDTITHVKPSLIPYASKKNKSGISYYSRPAAKWYKSGLDRSKERSTTYPGVAKNMALQWGTYLLEKYSKP